MPTRGESGTTRKPPPRRRKPSSMDKQAAIYAAEQNLKPWEVQPPPPPKPTLVKPPTRRVSQDERYHAAIAAPVDPNARKKLAETMTSERRRQYHETIAPPRPHEDTGFVHALTSTPGSIAHNITHGAGALAHGAEVASVYPFAMAVKSAIGSYEATPRGGVPIGGVVAPPNVVAGVSGAEAATHGLSEAALGPNLGRLAMGEAPGSKKGLLLDAALLLPGTKITRLARAAVEAQVAARGLEGAERAAAAERAFERAMEGQTLPGRVVTAARRSSTLKGPARVEAHRLIDEQVVDPAARRVTKAQFDAHVYDTVRNLPAGARKDAASQAYHQLGDAMRNTSEHPEIRPFRNARIEAELNPHYTPTRSVRPLNEARTAAHVEQSIADASRMQSLDRNPQHLFSMFQEAHRLASVGAPFRRWYQVSAERILSHVHGDTEEADKLAQLFGIYSANRSVDANSVIALRAYDEARAGLPITQGSAPQIEAATRVMRGEAWDGRKTNSFYSNMLKHIDPEKYKSEFGKREVTVDIWMMRMFGFKGKSPTEAQYNWIENQIRELAHQLGWEPEEVQAAAWVALKSETEKTSLETAAFDFAHGIDTHLGQVSYTARPSAMRVIAPEGRNLIHEIIGVPGSEVRADAKGVLTSGLPRESVDALNAPQGVARQAMAADDAARVAMVASGQKPGAIILTEQGARDARKAGLLIEYDPIPGKYGGSYWHIAGGTDRAQRERTMQLMRVANKLFRQEDARGGDILFGQAMGYSDADIAHYIEEKYGTEIAPQPRVLTKEEALNTGTSAQFVYHGTTREQARSIMGEGLLRVGSRAPEGVWFAEDPKAAAFFGDTILQVPRSLIPDSPRLPFGNYATESDLLFREGSPRTVGGISHLPLLRTKGPEGDYVISEAERKMAEQSAAAHGTVLDLPAVTYGRVFQAKTLGHANAIEISSVGDSLVQEITKGVGARTDVVRTANGVWLINRTGTGNKVWIKKMEEALGAINPMLVDRGVAVAFDGGKVERSHYAHLLEELEARRPGAGQALHGLAGDVERAGRGRAVAAEHSGPSAAARFDRALTRSRGSKYGAFLSDTDAAELEADGYRLFLGGPNDEIHFAISPKGDFGYFGSHLPGAGRAALAQAIEEGARTLDAFDGFLPAYYEKVGFREVARNPWNEEFAPEGWDYATHGRPDVVHMAYMPDAPKTRTNVVLDSWDEGKRTALAGVQARVPVGPSGIRFRPDFGGLFGRGPVEEVAAGPSRDELLHASADQFRSWRQANPQADDSLVADMVKQIADHNGVDEYGLRTFLDQGRIPVGTTETDDALGEIRRIGRESSATRREQARIQSQVRAERIAAGALEFERAGGGLEGHYASLAQLRGELPKLRFGNFENFSDEAVNALFAHIEGHPDLRPYERLRARNAILRVLTGNVPQKNEVRLLGKVFGRETAQNVVRSVPFHAQLRARALELWNLPRALMATFDMSAPFRQGLMTSTRHPVLFGRNFKLMVRAFGSEKVYEGLMNEIVSMPRYEQMVHDGISFTDLEHLETREESLIGGQLAERIPIAGIPVRASSRAYTGFLNKMRADMYNLLADKAEEMGLDLSAKSSARFAKGFTTPSKRESLGESLARYINSATGRGDLGAMKSHATTLNSLLFSPRLLASRINFINPMYYTRLDPFARREAIRSFASMMGMLSGVLYLAHLGGAEVGLDPRSADFAKIKIGDTRIDVLGGFQQPIRLLSQLYSGTIVSSTTGKKLNLASGKYGAMTRMDVLQRFFRSKTAPIPSVLWDLLDNQDFVGNKLEWQRELAQHTLPLAGQDAYDMYTQTGHWPLFIGSYAGSGVGFGIQTYGPRVPKSHASTIPADSGLGGLGGGLGGSLGGSP